MEEQHLELDQFDAPIPFQDAYLLAGGEILLSSSYYWVFYSLDANRPFFLRRIPSCLRYPLWIHLQNEAEERQGTD